MDSMTLLSNATHQKNRTVSNQRDSITYAQTEQELLALFEQYKSGLRTVQSTDLERINALEQDIYHAILKAFEPVLHDHHKRTAGSHLALQLLQRVLYHINQFLMDHPVSIAEEIPEKSEQLWTSVHQWRDRIEQVWQQWELTWLKTPSMSAHEVLPALQQRIQRDLHPPLSEHRRFVQEQLSQVGYQRLAAIAAARKHVEHQLMEFRPTDLGVAVQLACIQPLEADRTNQRFTDLSKVLTALNLDANPATYFDSMPWAVLATVNQLFLFRRNPLYGYRYLGAMLHHRIASAIAARQYQIAAERLNLPVAVANCWKFYREQDLEFLNNQLANQLEQWIQPILHQLPEEAWELVLGYDQQHHMNYRAESAVARSLREAERAKRRISAKHRAS